MAVLNSSFSISKTSETPCFPWKKKSNNNFTTFTYWKLTSDINNSKRHCLGIETFKHRSPPWNECINHPLEKLSFWVSKSNCCFCITLTLHDWLKNSCHFFIQSEVKPKPIRNSLRHVFPRFASATCIYYQFSLVHWIVCVLCDWLKW